MIKLLLNVDVQSALFTDREAGLLSWAPGSAP